MHSRSFGKLLFGNPLLALPLFVVPALCFTLNRASFLWSLAVIGITGWRLHRTTGDITESEAPVKGVFSRLALATFVLQMLAFVWIGAVWGLDGLGHLVMVSPVASRVVGWLQAQWFAQIAAWLVLFAVICGLFRLARPLLAWHQRAVHCALTALSQPDSQSPTAVDSVH